MGICGNYVKKFSEASHCLADNMPMNADYSFGICLILELNGNTVKLKGSGTEKEFKIKKRADGKEYIIIEQSSFFEKSFGRPPTKFKAYPFKDDRSPAIKPELFNLTPINND